LKELQTIKDRSLAGPSTYDLMISYHLKRGDGESALAMIDKAERNLGSEELFITEKLLASQQLQNAQQVQTVRRKCEQYPTRKANCKKLAPAKA
jgi:pentatricopeptide repeat protein